ncbi:hypothetical protein NFI96_030006 [Prochilodus magdalenae]|nr:hypothetical protein NFI96_030006 [Prochilodus magdalenae]
MSGFVQLALLAGLALCVALLLQRAGVNNNNNKETKAEGSAGHFPPMLHRKAAPEPARGSGGHFSRAHNPEAIARAKGGTTAGGKSNLTGQIIPVYGFGILLYILYIIFKITSKGKTMKPQESRFPAIRSENMKRKITDFELGQLQERLKETEEMMERIVSSAQTQRGSPDRAGPVSVDQEEALLLQLREITRVMHEGQLVEEFRAEPEAADPRCGQDVEDYTEGTDQPEETGTDWHQHHCRHHDHAGSRFLDGEVDTEGPAGGGNRPDGERAPAVSADCVCLSGEADEGEDDGERMMTMMMKGLEAFSAYEDKTFHRLSPENPDPCWSQSSGNRLSRRKTKSGAVRVA